VSRVGGCGRALRHGHDRVAVSVRGEGSDRWARFGGLQLCGNVWLCAVCSAAIRHQRALEVERVSLAHLAAGGGLYFVTLTLPHDAGNGLAPLLETVRGGWRDITGSKGWRERRSRFGLGYVSAVEITYGANGWHPHLHVLVVADRPMSGDEQDDCSGWLSARWAAKVESHGWRAPNEHGVRWQAVHGRDGGSALAAYLSKVQDAAGEARPLGQEMVRGDLKTGRKWSVTPFDLIDPALRELAHGRPGRHAGLWWEYEQATAGRRCLTWSRHLRARYALPDVEDEDLAADEPEETDECIALIDREDWERVMRHRADVALLEAAERAGLPGVLDLLVELRRRDARSVGLTRRRSRWPVPV
jgi:hypothetical protein